MDKVNTRICYECGSIMNKEHIAITYNILGKKITVENVMGYHCNNCGYQIIEDQEFSMIQNLLNSLPDRPEIDILNLEETADLLRVSNQTIYNKIKSGDLKAFKVGREWRFLRPDIEAYIYGRDPAQDIAMAARGGKISEKDLKIIEEEVEKRKHEN